MMKKYLLLSILFLGLKGLALADSMAARERLYLTSYTNTIDTQVLIATAPSILRAVIFGTTSPGNSTIYFYDGNIFVNGMTTRCAVNKSEDLYEIRFSSSLMYTKLGTEPVSILWDYVIKPSYLTTK